jgi:general secretion pathway protein E
MGVEPYLLASSLLGVLAQRLVRTLCPACRSASPPSAGEQKMLADIGLGGGNVHEARGCPECNHTGFRGRTGVYELLLVDDAIRRGIHDGADEAALRHAATRAGMTTLRRDGARWVAAGATSLAELVRVTREA